MLAQTHNAASVLEASCQSASHSSQKRPMAKASFLSFGSTDAGHLFQNCRFDVTLAPTKSKLSKRFWKLLKRKCSVTKPLTLFVIIIRFNRFNLSKSVHSQSAFTSIYHLVKRTRLSTNLVTMCGHNCCECRLKVSHYNLAACRWQLPN